MRLNKYIADAGICSRRKADELINDGKVKVNGMEISEFGFQVEESDVVEVDGSVIKLSARPPVYIMLNKPVGFITTVSDDRGRPTVFDLLEDIEERIFPVGRLDYNTSGLLILTTDGDFSNLMMHPKNNVYKTYVARVRGVFTHTQANILRKGVIIDGVKTAPALVEIERHGDKSTIVEIKIREGRNRQIRKMCEAVGHPVLELHRTAIGNLTLGHLKVGHYKKINPSDITALVNLAEKGGENAAEEKSDVNATDKSDTWAKPSVKVKPVGAGKTAGRKASVKKNVRKAFVTSRREKDFKYSGHEQSDRRDSFEKSRSTGNDEFGGKEKKSSVTQRDGRRHSDRPGFSGKSGNADGDARNLRVKNENRYDAKKSDRAVGGRPENNRFESKGRNDTGSFRTDDKKYRAGNKETLGKHKTDFKNYGERKSTGGAGRNAERSSFGASGRYEKKDLAGSAGKLGERKPAGGTGKYADRKTSGSSTDFRRKNDRKSVYSAKSGGSYNSKSGKGKR